MDARRWDQVQRLFKQVLDYPASERDALLADACGTDVELYAEVQSLLAADADERPLLDAVANETAALLAGLTHEGDTVGAYRLVRRLGTGGMGVVYLAERADGAFEHQVALKLIKRGMETEQILRRFSAERQVLARLQHENIARLLDGGVTAEGLPYIVMEYVAGEPIDVYCDRRRLSVEARLRLFMTVCKAVRYAHAHLVVHRDLKPANILVADDGTGQPHVKLLDFGIAKLLGDPGEEGHGVTQTGMRVMTPAYASPEQVHGEAVGTATDVYSLGAILYELLTGRPPYAAAGADRMEVERLITTTEPDKPSTAVSRVAARAAGTGVETSVDFARSTSVERLRRRLAGDLDVICLTALRREISRRYASAEALSEDVRRHLAGLPITARPDDVGYRVRKFVYRHRAGVVAAVVAILALTAFSAREIKLRRAAEVEAAKTREVVAFLTGLFETSDPSASQGRTITARELLDAGAARVEAELRGQPEVQTTLLDVLGDIYTNLWLFDEARSLYERSYAIKQRYLPFRSAPIAASLFDLAQVRQHAGAFEAADSLFRRALRVQRGLPDGQRADLARLTLAYGGLLVRRGDYSAAESVLVEAIGLHREAYEPDAPEMASALTKLGFLYQSKGAYDEAKRHLERALGIWRARHTGDHPDLIAGLSNLTALYNLQGRYEEAKAVCEEALAMSRRVFGADHPRTAMSLNDLAAVLTHLERYEEAEPHQREALRIYRATLGPRHPQIALNLNNLAILVKQRRDYDEAERLYRESLALTEEIYGREHPEVAACLNNLATLYLHQDRLDEAAVLFDEVLAIDRKLLGEEHHYVAMDLQSIGIVLTDRGAYAEAEDRLRASVAMYRKLLGDDHPDTAAALSELGRTLLLKDDVTEAERFLREALRLQSAATPRTWRIASTQASLGEVLARTGRDEEGESLLREGYSGLCEQFGPQYGRTARAFATLTAHYDSSTGGAVRHPSVPPCPPGKP